MTKADGSYYGGFFWLTMITFIVPLFVAYRAFDKLQPIEKPVPTPDISGVDHDLWDYLLKSYVENGSIDYQGIKRDYLFKIYLTQLAEAKPESLSTTAEKLALYCNAYNAFVIQGVINHKIKSTVREINFNGTGFFDLPDFILANTTYSLNRLEHEVIRPRFREPRIHMALVCAAKGCPAIRPEAYDGARLEQQLNDQAQLFCNNRKHVDFDPVSNQLSLSSILKWYGEDFAEAGGYLNWIAERVRNEQLAAKVLAADRGDVKIVFKKYDWSLNAQNSSRTILFEQPVAGSGTIPNQ